MATTDGNADRPADVARALSEVCRRLRDIVPSPEYDVRRSAFSSPAHTDVPAFRGFQDDAVRWVQVIDGLAARLAWPEHLKLSFAVQRLQNAARAWHLYEGQLHSTWETWSEALITAFGNFPGAFDARFMKMRDRRQGPGENVVTYVYEKLHLLRGCNLEWTSPVARQYVVDGLADSNHAAILAVQPPEMKLQAFIHLAAELQHSASREAREPYQQAVVRPLEESASPSPQWSYISLNDEEGTNATPLILAEDGAPHPKSPYLAGDLPMFSPVQTQTFPVGEPPSTCAGPKHIAFPESRPTPLFNCIPLECHGNPTEVNDVRTPNSCVGDEFYRERHQRTCALLGDIVKPKSSAANSSARSLPASDGPPEQRPDVLTPKPIPPSKITKDGSSPFVDIPTTSSMEHSNSKEATDGHISFITTCDITHRKEPCWLPEYEKRIPTDTLSNSSASGSEASGQEQDIASALSDDAERKDMSAEESNIVPSKDQVGDDTRVRGKNAPVADKDVSAAVIDGCFGAQEVIITEAILTCWSAEKSAALERARREDLNRASRSAHQEEMYNRLFSRSYADRQAIVRVPHNQFIGTPFRSVAECKDAKLCERKALSAVRGQSTNKTMRTAADWKRRKKKQGAGIRRTNMASA